MSFDIPEHILFVDSARYLGWAYGSPGSPPISGSIELTKAGASRAAQFANAARWISRFMKEHPVDLIAIEAPLVVGQVEGNTNKSTTDMAYGIPAVIEGFSHLLGCYRHERCPQQSIKKHFVNKGIGNQKAPIRKKCIALGWVTPDEAVLDVGYNRTDALAGWSYAETKFAPKIAQPVGDLFVRAMERKRQEAELAAAAVAPAKYEDMF